MGSGSAGLGKAGALLLATIVATVAVGATGIGSAGAKPVVEAQGSVECFGDGKDKGKASWSGSAPNVRMSIIVKAKLDCIGTTGFENDGVTVHGAKATFEYRHLGGTCSLNGVVGQWRLELKWKGKKAKISRTAIGYSNSNGTASGWELPSSVPPVGYSLVTGSYANSPGSTATIETSALAGITSACNQGAQKAKFQADILVEI